jgi:hypothetical protein
MATGDGGRMRDGKDIPPGSIVACTTNFDERFEGEVMAFDYGSKFVVISILCFHSLHLKTSRSVSKFDSYMNLIMMS